MWWYLYQRIHAYFKVGEIAMTKSETNKYLVSIRTYGIHYTVEFHYEMETHFSRFSRKFLITYCENLLRIIV
jgi:hypothetical protein